MHGDDDVLELSLSSSYRLRWQGITYDDDGDQADPRTLVVPQFQLLDPNLDTFGAWAAGAWETNAPVNGPYVAWIVVGSGQSDPVNPGVAGYYRAWCQIPGAVETPVFPVRMIKFRSP